MSLTVQNLNGDATFLLTFTPPNSKYNSFTILFDPWLSGDSPIYHRSFANSRHKSPPAIESLSSLEKELDLIVISQEKADHLSKETLCTLPKDTNVKILATAKAAKKILGWKYFTNGPDIVQVMKPYQGVSDDTVIRIPIAEGEVKITNIVEKRDFTNLHNAIWVTYSPPDSKPTTLLFSPHGLRLDSASLGPITFLFHPLTRESNPWFLGGLVCTGAPGGIALARELKPKWWISAHDGVKEVEGWATRWTKSREYGVGEVQELLEGTETEVVVLERGEGRRFDL